jgi:hypothetical protein
MAQTKATAKKPAARKTTARKTAARKPQPKKTVAPEPQSGTERAIDAAERLVKVQVGAVLEVRDSLRATVEGLQSEYGTSDAAEKQIKRFERRGTKATKAAERRVKKTRTRVERELRTRRRTAEKRVTAERKRLEREARNAAERVDAVREAVRQIDLANGAEFVQTQFGQAVQTGVEVGTQAYRRASERIGTVA